MHSEFFQGLGDILSQILKVCYLRLPLSLRDLYLRKEAYVICSNGCQPSIEADQAIYTRP